VGVELWEEQQVLWANHRNFEPVFLPVYSKGFAICYFLVDLLSAVQDQLYAEVLQLRRPLRFDRPTVHFFSAHLQKHLWPQGSYFLQRAQLMVLFERELVLCLAGDGLC